MGEVETLKQTINELRKDLRHYSGLLEHVIGNPEYGTRGELHKVQEDIKAIEVNVETLTQNQDTFKIEFKDYREGVYNRLTSLEHSRIKMMFYTLGSGGGGGGMFYLLTQAFGG